MPGAGSPPPLIRFGFHSLVALPERDLKCQKRKKERGLGDFATYLRQSKTYAEYLATYPEHPKFFIRM
jgi:hypothetical protein